ncbi:site-specific DNA-methyltransferase [Caldicellulosiruptor acetigenus]|uniref:site-specific DNA-methyltransferase n=1 Tax=Caldicellulosiruptor acetigenus TaxID=301953 RepID=UPI000400477C|nr:site-specific DNA-methyltransferase [Caldicellulosiruptor acetigenus]WAM36914.1 site-specific DNA-methyltransferase [Caldicellulosiruptor acetigenus]
MQVNEKKFYDALENLFVGAKVEGEGGYINLLKIKSQYCKKVLEQFKREVEEDPIITDSFKEEFFDKLYSFFEKYFSESGSVYFVKTANWQRVYEQIYTDNKDVVLFWKTHMLYYVKSDILFRSMNVEVTDDETGISYNFYFDVGNLENKKNNERKELVFNFREVKEEGEKKVYVFDVTYSERGTKTKIDDIVKKTKIPEEILEKAFRTFKRQSEVDFFINKNAKKFLEEQLDMYLHQILLAEENKFDQKRLDQLKTIHKYAKKIIAFISQFEDELVRVWNKPKFVLNSNYVITLDKLSDEIINRIANHPNLNEQIKEWIELGIVEEGFDFNKRDKEKHKYLPIDTKYFKDLELDILNLFDNLDEALDGRLIHSENYQALNTLLPKYKEKVQTIYIDPPFNLDSSDQFMYRTNYKDASWATLLENRIRLAREWLKDSGSIFVRCDYNGNWIVRCLLDDIFGQENFRNELIVNRINKQDPKAKKFNTATDTVYLFSKTDNFYFKPIFKKLKKAKSERWHSMDSQGQGKPLYIFGCLLNPPEGRHWTYGQESIINMEKEGKIRIKCRLCGYIHTAGRWSGCPNCGNETNVVVEYLLSPTEEKQIDSNWTDIPGYSSNWGFSTENSEILLKRVIESTSCENDLVMDFFLGSGTTTAVAHKLKRKWIGIEMGEHFYTVILPRMKKVLAYDKSGISKEKDVEEKYNSVTAGGFFKYYELEQYEDVLRNMKYKDNTPADILDTKKAFEQYIFFADEKFAYVLEVNGDKLEIDFDKLYPNIDFAETISNLLGLPIKKITKTSVILQDGDREKEIKIDYKNMSNEEKLEFVKLLKPLLWWGE